MADRLGEFDSVLFLSGVRGDTRRYRSLHPYEQLRLAGVRCMLSHLTDPQLGRQAQQATHVIFHRVACDRNVEKLIRSIQARGGVAIFDTDDLVFDPAAFRFINSPDFQDRRRVELYQEEMRRYRAALELCNAVITSTDYLAQQARALGKPVWVHRNAFSLEMLERSQAAQRHRQPISDKVVIGYASGTPTHDHDFAVVRPVLQQIMRRYPQVELWLVGPLDIGGGWGDLSVRVRHMGRVPWRELPQILAQFDINIAPLVTDNPFAQSKSEIKYVEAGLVQVPTVASPTDAYCYAIRSGDNGYLAQDERQWEEHLSALIEQEALRSAMAERACQDVLGRYHPQVRAQELIKTLEQITQVVLSRPFRHGVAKPAAGTLTISAKLTDREFRRLEQSPSLPRMAWYSWRHRGVSVLVRQILVYCRRLIAPIIPYRAWTRSEG